MKKIISILTPTFNGYTFLSKCADSLFSLKDKSSFEWIVLSDKSTDGTEEFLNDLSKQYNIKIITPDVSVSNFAKSNNIMAKIAIGKYILLLNDDCYLTNGSLDNLVNRFESDPSIGIAGSLLLFPETDLIQHCGVTFENKYYKDTEEGQSKYSGFLPGHIHEKQSIACQKSFIQKTRLFQSVTGACLMTRKILYDQLGGLDENFEFGYEDVDFCLRVGQCGYKIICEPSSVGYHHGSATLKNAHKNERALQLHLKNKKIFITKWKSYPSPDLNIYHKDVNFNLYTDKIIDPKIVYIPSTRGHPHDIYRTDNIMEGLKLNKANADIVYNSPLPQRADIVIFQRHLDMGLFAKVKNKYPRAMIGYDIDDYLFNKKIALDGGVDPDLVRQTSDTHNLFMSKSDFVLTTTEYLQKNILSELSKMSFVVPNCLPIHFIDIANKIHPNNTSNVILGYLSGSKSHNIDFSLTLNVIEQIMDKYPNVILRILGYLSVPKSFIMKFNDRIDLHEFIPYSQYPEFIASLDVCLAPLVNSAFNNAKSPLKFIEAGIFSIPTVASNLSGYNEAIDHGKNGFLCNNETDWYNSIDLLVQNKNIRQQIGLAARSEVLSKFTSQNVGKNLLKIFQSVLRPGYKKSDSKNKFISTVNTTSIDIHPPPLDLIKKYGWIPDKEIFINSGRIQSNLILKETEVKSFHRILDIGCGIGRIALHLTKFINRGKYLGVDTIHNSVEWCNKNISTKYPSFSFLHLDVQNSLYNPYGSQNPSLVRFPFVDKSFDIVIMYSVLLHMLPEHWTNYIKEIHRLLVPKGKFFATIHAITPDSEKSIKENKSLINFILSNNGKYYTADVNLPESAIAVQIEDVYQYLNDAGFNDVSFHPGFWCGTVGAKDGEDIIIATK